MFGQVLIEIGFVSGMPICEAFAQIENQPNIYDVVHVKYFDEVQCLLADMWIIGNLCGLCLPL